MFHSTRFLIRYVIMSNSIDGIFSFFFAPVFGMDRAVPELELAET